VTDTSPHRSETVLIVDDEPAIRELLRVVLRMNGYRVLEAAHGQDALRICESFAGPLHLLLTDILMPGMNGKELAQQIQRLRPELKTLLISGYIGALELQDWLSRPGVAFLPKPFNVNALEQKLRELLDAHHPLPTLSEKPAPDLHCVKP